MRWSMLYTRQALEQQGIEIDFFLSASASGNSSVRGKLNDCIFM